MGAYSCTDMATVGFKGLTTQSANGSNKSRNRFVDELQLIITTISAKQTENRTTIGHNSTVP